jgi:hypothetical protein
MRIMLVIGGDSLLAMVDMAELLGNGWSRPRRKADGEPPI